MTMLTDAARRREAARVVERGYSDLLERETDAMLVVEDVEKQGALCVVKQHPDGWRVVLAPFTPDDAA